jgi:hypothetical protein
MIAGILSKATLLLSRLSLTATGNIDYLDDILSNKALSATAVSNATLTPARSALLDNVYPLPCIKNQVSGAIAVTLNPNLSPPPGNFLKSEEYSSIYYTADKQGGLRHIVNYTNASGNLIDILDISGAGWLLGFMTNAVSVTPTVQLKATVDGVVFCDTGYSTLTSFYTRVILGMVVGSTSLKVKPSPFPLRFNNSLLLQHKADSVNAQTSVVYLLD